MSFLFTPNSIDKKRLKSQVKRLTTNFQRLERLGPKRFLSAVAKDQSMKAYGGVTCPPCAQWLQEHILTSARLWTAGKVEQLFKVTDLHGTSQSSSAHIWHNTHIRLWTNNASKQVVYDKVWQRVDQPNIRQISHERIEYNSCFHSCSHLRL